MNLQWTLIDELRKRCGERWENIQECCSAAEAEHRTIDEALSGARLIPTDASVVVVGSLARREWTTDSDLDWMLLVDGQADEAHLTAAQNIRALLYSELGFKKPGPTAVFGGPTFSHELIHRIGGDADSNQNTTRRVLLLLESTSIGKGSEVRERVVRQLLKRYVEDDLGYYRERKPYVPRFLLNDIVRFWRTMAVDFAAKRREREGDGWALRQFKLRMSRKLIFAAGLAACLACELCPGSALKSEFGSDGDFFSAMTTFLLGFTSSAPLPVLASTCITFKAEKAAKEIFGAYDEFLAVMKDTKQRTALDALDPEAALANELFRRSNDISDRFQDGLTKLFFETDRRLTGHVQRFGVF